MFVACKTISPVLWVHSEPRRIELFFGKEKGMSNWIREGETQIDGEWRGVSGDWLAVSLGAREEMLERYARTHVGNATTDEGMIRFK